MPDAPVGPRKTEGTVCIGYGDREGTCTNVAGTPWTPLWCMDCDEERRATITAQMDEIKRSLGG